MEKIFVDAAQSAVILPGSGLFKISSLTMQEAVMAFLALSPAEKAKAIIVAADDQRYATADVEKLHDK